MTTSMTDKPLKSTLRKTLKLRRRVLARANRSPDVEAFFRDMKASISGNDAIAGFSPIGDEIDIWPFLRTLQKSGRRIALPVVAGRNLPLTFREWTPDCVMQTDRYGVSCPAAGETLTPKLILVPLLAFTPGGDRLGYGGGYYDRTLAALRQEKEVFACGVAYAGQEVAELPTDAHDAKLDGILTENGFKVFA